MKTKKTIQSLVAVTAGVVAFFVSGNTEAYQYKTWDDEKVNWCDGQKPWLNINQQSFPDDSPFQKALLSTIEQWNANLSSFDYQYQVVDFDAYEIGDGYVDVVFVDDDDPNIKSYPAVSWKVYDTWDGDCLYDADILFRNTIDWTTSDQKEEQMEYSAGGHRSFQTAALHELGHSLGLGHEDRFYNIMGVDWKQASVNGEDFEAMIGADAQAGALFLYNLTDQDEEETNDWMVAHYKYSKEETNDEYADAVRTEVFNPQTGKVLDNVDFDDVKNKAYKVYPGEAVSAEFNIQVVTKAPGEEALLRGLYSLDSQIDSGDQTLSEQWLTCKDQTCVGDWKIGMSIPPDAKPGVAYLGGWINADKGSVEKDFKNNASYTPVIVENPPVQAQFTVIAPLESKIQKAKHLEEFSIVSGQMNTVKARLTLDSGFSGEAWDVDWIYFDQKKKENKVVSGKILPGQNPEFVLENVSDGKTPQNINVRLKNAESSFGASFSIKGTVVPYQKPFSITPETPSFLAQTPANGLFTTYKLENGKSDVNITLFGKVGNVPEYTYGPFTLQETCQIKFRIFSKENPLANPIVFYSKEASPQSFLSTTYAGKLKPGSYYWTAQTVCGLKGAPFMAAKESKQVKFPGPELKLEYYLDTQKKSSVGDPTLPKDPPPSSLKISIPRNAAEKKGASPKEPKYFKEFQGKKF